MKPSGFRKFLFFKLPIAWIAGLRLHSLNKESAIIKVKLTRFSMNPFKSIFWAVQGMAAEISTGIILSTEIMKSNQKISFLVIEQNAKFHKKAVGTVQFKCTQVQEIKDLVKRISTSNESESILLKSVGIDEASDMVSEFSFLWSLKRK